MSADNWQDTALHLSIIENLKQGNFPPQAPYFSGHELKYHYFTDLHTAILTFSVKEFLPRIIILDNSILAAIFSLSIYALAYLVTGSKKVSIFSTLLALFSGSLIYVNLVRDYFLKDLSFKEMISGGSYVMEYGKLFQMAPMTNYFLQNRPMMVGLISIAVSVITIFIFIKEKKYKYLFLTLFIAITTINFQFFSSLIIFVLSIFAIFINDKRKLIYLIAPMLITPYLFKDYLGLFINNLSEGLVSNNRNLYWFLSFIIANFGVPLILFLILLLLLILRRIRLKLNILFLIILFIGLIILPAICSFTIDKADMLKFFYIAYIPLSVLSSIVLERISRKKLGLLFVMVLIFMSTWTGINDLIGSYLNKNLGYTTDDMDVGNWVRNNTPKKSVFLTYPTVHSPVSDIAGRLRVMSYSNWPYTHGYNTGDDNIFVRSNDINSFYNSLEDVELTQFLISKYNINYVYYGPDESSNFPEAENGLESNILLEKIYDQNNIKIYKRIQ